MKDWDAQLNEEQACAPAGQYPALQLHSQTPPLPVPVVIEQELTTLLEGGRVAQLVQESPQDETPSATQLPLQPWNPLLQVSTHAPLTQAPVLLPISVEAQLTQPGPQTVALSATQLVAAALHVLG